MKTKKDEPQNYFEAVYNAMPDPVILVDANGIVLRANKTYIKSFNMVLVDVIGKPFTHNFPVPQETKNGIVEAYKLKFRLRDATPLEIDIPVIEGKKRWIRDSLSFFDFGEATYCIATMHEFTDLKEAEEKAHASGKTTKTFLIMLTILSRASPSMADSSLSIINGWRSWGTKQKNFPL
jgi:PAS domain S-box-containing protein